MGEETLAFERECAQFLGVKHAIACSSGTAALHLAMLALGVGPGSRVIQPAINFVAGANMTIACGAEPVFADISSLAEPTLSPADVAQCLERTAGAGAVVLVMHYGGYPCRMDELLGLCRDAGVPIVEDACHSPGGVFAREDDPQPRALGTLGDIGCFSFFSNKNLATGEGGMAVTDQDDLALAMRALRSHGMTTLTWDRHRGHAATYDVTVPGFNYRIDELRSALGRAQLARLPAANERRRALTRLYWQALGGLEERGWVLPFKAGFEAEALEQSACHLMTAVAPDGESRWRAAAALQEAGIQSSLHYPFVPGFHAFRARGGDFTSEGRLPTSAEFAGRTLTLPLFPSMQDADVLEVSRALI
jgi:dTDP-4-amino-4,6-dideoxygalactose transaminase